MYDINELIKKWFTPNEYEGRNLAINAIDCELNLLDKKLSRFEEDTLNYNINAKIGFQGNDFVLDIKAKKEWLRNKRTEYLV